LVRLTATLVLLALLCGAPAWAGGHGAKKAEAEGAFAGPRIPTILMPTLVAPMIIDGALHHYVFLSVTLELTDDNHKSMMLEKIPYLQDAFVREVHGASIAKNNDAALIDDESLKSRLLRASAVVVGPNVVKTIQLRNAARVGR
jgi:hypothetical protein